MRLGLGSGSTIAYFLEALGKRCRQGLKIHGVATSRETESIAQRQGIPLIDLEPSAPLDLAIDGADQANIRGELIKGRGGALLREKIVATGARRLLILIDESKLTRQLGTIPLPIEIIPFGYKNTLRRMAELLSLPPEEIFLRTSPTGGPFLTDNGNYIADLSLHEIDDPHLTEITLKEIPGVLETGLFYLHNETIWIASPEGTLSLLPIMGTRENTPIEIPTLSPPPVSG